SDLKRNLVQVAGAAVQAPALDGDIDAWAGAQPAAAGGGGGLAAGGKDQAHGGEVARHGPPAGGGVRVAKMFGEQQRLQQGVVGGRAVLVGDRGDGDGR